MLKVGNGDSVIFGGGLADTITSGSGNDLICGDHCHATFNTTLFCGAGCVPTAANTLVRATMQLEFVVTTYPNVTGGMCFASYSVLPPANQF